MRRTKPVRLGELWDDFLKSAPTFAYRLAEAKLPDAWTKIAGQAVAYYTTKVYIDKGVMYVHISSAVIRHEVFMRREQLRLAVNNEVGVSVVKILIIK